MAIRDILKSNGYSDEQIEGIVGVLGGNANAMKVFDEGLTAADEKLRAAQQKLEEADRKQEQMKNWWEQDASKQINEVWSERDNIKARNAFLEEQVRSAKESGFIAADAPATVPPAQTQPQRSPDGRFIPNANTVPGSPAYMTQEEGWKALSNASWAITTYPRLFNGQPLPDDIATLVQESTNARMQFQPYVAQKYNFKQREQEIAATNQKTHDDKIAKEALDAYKKEHAERNGSNPDLRAGMTSNFSKFQQPAPGSPAAQQNIPDRLSWSRPDARERMRNFAHELVAKEQQKVQ